jgi:pimeloyl-ACP methyl ester carboxylesterase
MSAAAAAALAPRTVTLPTGVTLPYVERGRADGTPVIFLHGVTDSWRSFEHVLPLLPESIRAIAVTQRGHGDASRPAEYTYTAMANDVVQLMDALRISSAVLVGHSMGSLIAQSVAIDHPDRTRGLVLVAGLHTVKGHPEVEAMWQSVLATLADPVDPAFVRGFQESTVANPLPAGQMDTFVAESLKVPARVWQALFRELLEADFSAELSRITAPTLIMAAGKDGFSRREERDALATRIARAVVRDYPEAGHAIHWESPATLAREVAAFVATLPARAESSQR